LKSADLGYTRSVRKSVNTGIGRVSAGRNIQIHLVLNS